MKLDTFLSRLTLIHHIVPFEIMNGTPSKNLHKPAKAKNRELNPLRSFQHKSYAQAFLVLVFVYTSLTCAVIVSVPSWSRNHIPPLASNETRQGVLSFLRRQPNSSSDRLKIHQSKHARIREVQNTFPVHVKDDREEISHPGILFAGQERLSVLLPDLDFPKTLQVPRFWDPSASYRRPIRDFLGDNGRRVLTAEEARSVGSLYKGKETIFLSVASYRDQECLPTVESIFLRAKYPERIRVAIVDQVEATDRKCSQPELPCDQDPEQVLCKFRHLIDVLEVPAYQMVGPVFARHLSHRMYRGEYFSMQVDAHVRFTQDWDEDLIAQWRSANNEMAVLSTYLTDISDSIDSVTHKSLKTKRNMMCWIEFEGSGISQHLMLKGPATSTPAIQGTPMLHPFWSAGFSFARGHFIVQVPYDQFLPMLFQGEEADIAIRGFTFGYDFYAPELSVAFHIFAIKGNIARRERHKYWENEILYTGALEKSLARLNGIIVGTAGELKTDFFHEDVEKYGVGGVREKETYYRAFGFHTDTQTTEGHLCQFVEESMHKKFQPHLRQDGMGIDYSTIDYEYVDAHPSQHVILNV